MERPDHLARTSAPSSISALISSRITLRDCHHVPGLLAGIVAGRRRFALTTS
jgi:hypothetical protein